MAEEKNHADVEKDEDKLESDDIEDGEEAPSETKASDSEGEGDEVEDGEEGEEPEIPVRRSFAQHIIARKNKTIEKLRSKAAEDGDDDEEEIPPEESNDGLTPEAQNAVQREVSKAVAPIVKTLVSKADEDELKELYGNEPEAKKFDKRIRAYMNSPHYKGVPSAVIYHHLAFDQAETTGSRRRNSADVEAAHQRGGGRPLRPNAASAGDVPSVDEIEDMSEEEFENLQHKARTGRFVKK